MTFSPVSPYNQHSPAVVSPSDISPHFGSFTLLAKLARGDVGDLFLARSQGAGGFEKLVIIKRIHAELMADKNIANTFYQEARTAAHIEHPNVRMVYEIGNNQEHHYIALEYLEGVPLVDVLLARRRHPKLADPRFVTSLLSQACAGLHAAHTHKYEGITGRVHGDLNPRSLFITASGTTKILDFDIARMRTALSGRHGFVRRTSAYMSPEEVRTGKCDSRSDVFSLGAVAWEAVTGRRLFKRNSQDDTLRAITDESVPSAKGVRPEISDALNATVLRALHHDPSLRFQSAQDFGAALDRALQQEGAPLTPLTITAQIQSAFANTLKEQRDFVRAARGGRAQSDELVRSYRARSEDSETVVAPPVEEIDEWESDFNVATKVVDYEQAMSAIAVALEHRKATESGRVAREASADEDTQDPFREVTAFADFSDAGVAPSWGDTQNLVLSSLGLPDTPDDSSVVDPDVAFGDSERADAVTRIGKQIPQIQSSSQSQKRTGAQQALSLPPVPKLSSKTEILPSRKTSGAIKVIKSKRLVGVLAGATLLVIAAIVVVMLRTNGSNESAKVENSPPQELVESVGLDAGKVNVMTYEPVVRDSGTVTLVVDAGETMATPDASIAESDAGASEVAIGSLRLSSSSRGRLFINGERRGYSPTTIELPVGRHKIRIVNAKSGKSKTVYVEIRDSEETRRRIRI